MDKLKFKTYSENIPTDALNLKESYPNIFSDFQKLKTELQYIYVDEEFNSDIFEKN